MKKLCVLMFSLLLSTALKAAVTNEEAVGVAYLADATNEAPIYTETHQRTGDTHTVEYRLDDGTRIASNTLDFSPDPYAPAFRLELLAENASEGGRWDAGHYIVEAKGRSESLDSKGPLVASSGFNAFMRARLGELEGGNTVKFDFAVPNRHTTVRFAAEYEGTDERGYRKIRVGASGLLSLIVSDITLFYDAEARLREYRGISGIPVAGDQPDVVIRYFYDEEIATISSSIMQPAGTGG